MHAPPCPPTGRRPLPTAAAVIAVLLAALTSCDRGADDVDASRPRLVLLVLVDTLRADHLGCYGHDRDTSPEIDEFAGGAVRYSRAFAPTSWTKPSIPSLFTGRLPSGHGVFEGNSKDEAGRITSDVLADDQDTLAEAMQAAGYATGGFVKNAHLKPFLGFAQGFDVYEEGIGDAAAIHEAFLRWVDESLEARPDQPLFGYVHVLDVHWPYLPPADAAAKFPVGDVGLDLSEAGQKALRDAVNDGERELTVAEQGALRTLYDACIRGYDRRFGELLDGLRTRGPVRRRADRVHLRPRRGVR